MAVMSREETLARYRGLREINKRHQTEAVRFVPHAALVDQARRIGLAIGKTLVADSIDELTLAFDLALYTAPPGRSRGIERYARAPPFPLTRRTRRCFGPCVRPASPSGRLNAGMRRR